MAFAKSFTDSTNNPTQCFDSRLHRCKQKQEKVPCTFTKEGKLKNIATTRKESPNHVSNIFGYLFTNSPTLTKQQGSVTLERFSLLLFFSSRLTDQIFLSVYQNSPSLILSVYNANCDFPILLFYISSVTQCIS